MRIQVRQTDDEEEQYFMKISVGHNGKEALKGEFESTAAIHSITPDFCPKPIAWGTFHEDSDSHFYVCKFYEFTDGVPEPVSFCEKLARLHAGGTSPEGKFGFHCTTYNGDLPQENSWSDSWEAFFDKGLRHVLKVREERAGPNQELDALLPTLFEEIIPRLLRPLESGGRKIRPSLVHGDLWCGNAGIIDEGTEDGIVYDPASFWAHNECNYFIPCKFAGQLTNNRTQMSWEIGVLPGTSLRAAIFRSTTPTCPKQSPRRTTTIATLSTPCEKPSRV
jgi:fructosamine-3-kinase